MNVTEKERKIWKWQEKHNPYNDFNRPTGLRESLINDYDVRETGWDYGSEYVLNMLNEDSFNKIIEL